MNLEDVRGGMAVVITAGSPEHPLHGSHATVVTVTAPLPEVPPRSHEELHLIPEHRLLLSNTDDEGSRRARAFRPGFLEAPFAWPDGHVLLSLAGDWCCRGWISPYIGVAPGDIEEA